MTHYLNSGKKKKEALMKKKKKKLKQNIENYDNEKDIIDEKNDSKTIELTKSFGGVYDEKDKSGPIPSIFQKEPTLMIENRKKLGTIPLDLSKRDLLLISQPPYDVNIYPNLYHPTRQLWNPKDNKETHEKKEQDYFDKWKINIQNEFSNDNCIIPFENNIDVWRQLWRTIEQSDVIILVIDIRNPLLHIPPSLIDNVINYYKKRLIGVLTKIDLVSEDFYNKWVIFLKKNYTCFYDFLPFTKQPTDNGSDGSRGGVSSRLKRLKKKPIKNDDRVQYMVQEIIEKCSIGYDLSNYKELPGMKRTASLTIGCIGHPNVGKSSLLNSIIGEKVLGVSRTAGHTKHIQHIFLNNPNGICVMDCPGLIFPMKQPRYILELCGLFPIAQIRETFSAINFLASYIELERLYALKLPEWYLDDNGKGVWSSLAICEALGEKKSYYTSKGCGAPDVHRAGLEIIKNCVDGVVCLCFNPPINI